MSWAAHLQASTPSTAQRLADAVINMPPVMHLLFRCNHDRQQLYGVYLLAAVAKLWLQAGMQLVRFWVLSLGTQAGQGKVTPTHLAQGPASL
jgi:hypothetical protein